MRSSNSAVPIRELIVEGAGERPSREEAPRSTISSASASPLRRIVELALPVAILAFTVVAGELVPFDVRVSDRFFDWASGTWTYRRDFLFQRVLHDGASVLLASIGVAALLVAIASVWVPGWRRFGGRALAIAAAQLASILVIGLLKKWIGHPCPWEVDRYGGELPFLDPFTPLPEGARAGTGFPAAHAGYGFSLFALYFAWCDRDPSRARKWLWIAIAVGNAFGLVQVARGAHFLSHQVWSGVLVWYLCMLLDVVLFARRARAPAPRSVETIRRTA